MIEFVYNTLALIGFEHPLHPIATHVPMGMIIGGFIFRLASFKWKDLEKTAHYCFTMALIFAPVTVLLGIMDWQHRLFGKMSGLIIAKLILGGIVMLLLALELYLYRKGKNGNSTMIPLYALIFGVAIGLGFIGGQIVFG